MVSLLQIDVLICSMVENAHSASAQAAAAHCPSQLLGNITCYQ